MIREALLGAAAGAAGTTALNISTYLDMALRARPASTTLQPSRCSMSKASTSMLIRGSVSIADSLLPGSVRKTTEPSSTAMFTG